jgi:MoaA/NifB/PqqE/SkfB family radical SAM enzyme
MSELRGLRRALRKLSLSPIRLVKAHFQENRRSRSSEAEICSGTHSNVQREQFLSAGQGASRRTPQENALLMAEEYSAGRLIIANFPTDLTIESTSICNLRCVMCPHGINDVHRPRHMPVRILDSLAEAAQVVSKAQLHGIGEPLASPVFWRALESNAFHPDTTLSVNTNLTVVNDRHLRILVCARHKLKLNISLDAATERTYRHIRGADFSEVTRNILRLCAARGDRGSPIITINMTLMHDNIEEAPAFVELAQRLGVDGVLFWPLNRWPEEEMARYKVDRGDWHFDYAEQGLWNHRQISNRCVRAAVRRGKEIGIPVYLDNSRELLFDHFPATMSEMSVPAAEHRSAAVCAASDPRAVLAGKGANNRHEQHETVKDCRFPWKWAMITTDGEVRPCCYATGVLGNLNDTSFLDIWNGKKMQDLRSDIKANQVNSLCQNAACKYVQNMPKLISDDDSCMRSNN